ncbi:DUF1003 domain-containing protein [Sphaerotilus uruguayifluvii]|uniref:Membrane protein n=1 Tax=Sphaerotilus uruguayifluvii TaxID=2735897 RepID=A0ABX2G8X8_9BURK|nr:DUF1003 domain-containing protein [Leptothrix sp. C29]NRT58544.1 putative membrane protein [Leptothrix sp. C29]
MSSAPTATSGGVCCAVCGHRFARRDTVAAPLLRESLAAEIHRDHPDWNERSRICHADLARYRSRHIQTLLVAEKGELSELDSAVLDSLRTHQTLASDVESDYAEQRSLGERLADRIADFGGSWAFLISFSVFIAVWIAVNSLVMFWRPVDPYPFILLNLLLSCLAAVQAPIIMMSQNRQEAKDRLRARNDYQINLKAELEIRHLHEKVDHLLSHQWERMIEIQEMQIDLLDELRRRH